MPLMCIEGLHHRRNKHRVHIREILIMASVRHRPVAMSDASKSSAPWFSEKDVVNSSYRPINVLNVQRKFLRESLFLVIFVFYGLFTLYVRSRNSAYPTPNTVDLAQPGQFIEERARQNLLDITSIGSRPVGSPENEDKAVNFLLNEITAIQNHASHAHTIDVDVQRVSGNFSLDFLGQFTSVYDNVNNIAVKLSPKMGANHSLLINCHYDTVFNSTGASDDAVSCCIMLEVLRVLSADLLSFQHNIIFLFNGAEENILQASHGFITKHPWAKQIRAFINLDAAGAGGRELLFQAGPGNPWLISMYAEHAPHPFASVLGQEIFESGLIPSDTDYRIFRDFGSVPGIDIAYIANGYVYHTKFDSPAMIPVGCIQRGGENLLALVKAVSNSSLLIDPGEYRHGSLVFFDVLGHVMIIYPARMSVIINTMACFLVFLRLGCQIFGHGPGFHKVVYLKHLGLAICILNLSWLAAVLIVMLVGLALDWSGHSLSWYTNTWLVLGLYVAPALIALLVVAMLAKRLLYMECQNMWSVESVYFDAVLLNFTLALGLLTWYRIGSAVILLFFVAFPLLMRGGVWPALRFSPQDDHAKFLLFHILGLLIPSVMGIYAVSIIFVTFIPIMGRAGTETMPDLFIGSLAALTTILLFSYQTSLIYVCRQTKNTVACLTFLWIASGLLAVFTPIGFPFNANEASPTRQRIILHHVDRKIHDITGQVVDHQSGILCIPLDRVGFSYLKPYAALGLDNVTQVPCDDLPYCGWPYYFPMIKAIRTIFLKTTPAFEAHPKAELFVVNKLEIKRNLLRIVLSVTGPSHINIYLSPRSNVRLAGWSVGNHKPTATDMPLGTKRLHYFLFYSYGRKPDVPLELQLDLELESAWSDDGHGLLDVALGAHYLATDGNNSTTPELRGFVEALPDWTVPMAWVATYEAWVV